MSSLQTNLTNAFTRIATESKALRTLINGNASNLSSLTTTAKGNLVAAINELDAAVDALSAGAAGIDDASITTTSTWSSSKTSAEIAALLNDALTSGEASTWSVDKIVSAIAAAATQVKSDLTDGAGPALDTLKELADALGGDATFATTVNSALGNRLRIDAVQSMTAGQKTQACTNLGIGEPDTDFVATFEAGLV